MTCLMQTSVDGKIMIDRWPDPDAAEGEYERVHDLHHADAWLCGSTTLTHLCANLTITAFSRDCLSLGNPLAIHSCTVC